MEMPNQENLLSMRCCLCHHILSVAPIVSLSNDATQLRCGRCCNVSITPTIRLYVFEEVMKTFHLPCSYEGCDEKMLWKAVTSHEKACPRKTITCPLIKNQQCDGRLRERAVAEHMDRFHRSSRYFESLDAVLGFDEIYIGVLVYDSQYFYVLIRHVMSSPEVFVASANDVGGKYIYHMKIRSMVTKDKTSILVERLPIPKYDDREHCFPCLNRDCDKIHHPYSNYYEYISTAECHWIDRSKIHHVLGEGRIMISVVVRSKEEDKQECIMDVSKKDVSKMDVSKMAVSNAKSTDLKRCPINPLKRKFQCPNCGRYFVGKIFHCKEGHLICDHCEQSLTQCPTCWSRLKNLRNFPLEDVVETVVLACDYSVKGCPFTGKLQMLSLHEAECAYKSGDDGAGPSCSRS